MNDPEQIDFSNSKLFNLWTAVHLPKTSKTVSFKDLFAFKSLFQ